MSLVTFVFILEAQPDFKSLKNSITLVKVSTGIVLLLLLKICIEIPCILNKRIGCKKAYLRATW